MFLASNISTIMSGTLVRFHAPLTLIYDFGAAAGRGLAGQAAAAATGVVGGEGGLPERDAQVGLKTGWENPVPTGIVYRISRPNIVLTGKTRNWEKNREKPTKSGSKTVQVVS